MTTETLFFIGACVFTILVLFVPGIMGIVTGEFSIYNKGHNYIYKGQKAVVAGWGMLVTSTCLLIGLYLLFSKNTNKNLYTALVVVGCAAILITGIISFFVEGTITKER